MMAGGGHFVVTPESCVEDMLKGLAIMFPSLTIDAKSRIILYTQGQRRDFGMARPFRRESQRDRLGRFRERMQTGPSGAKGEQGPLRGRPTRPRWDTGGGRASGLSWAPMGEGGEGPLAQPGLPGEKEERSLSGAASAPSLPGHDGMQREEGPQDLPGLLGEGGEGPLGQPGLPGEKGERSLSGAAGAPSLPGHDGLQGEEGPQDLPGLLGEGGERPLGQPGLPGEKGERSLSGAVGAPSLPGHDGLQGEEGPQDLPGLPGEMTGFPSLDFPCLPSGLLSSRYLFQEENFRPPWRTVGLLSGGGSGHEPFAAGFVGKGMLTGAVVGKIFASPPPTTILKAICNLAKISPGGVLVLFNNYTGDCLNFGLAMEKAKLRGLKVKSVVVDEDCAIDCPRGAGKRGLCGSIFLFKIAGGMAERGECLESIYNECLIIKKNIATFGVTLKSCTMPGSGPMFEIEEGFMDLGVGIHGEAGASKLKIAPADEISCILVDKLCKTLNITENVNVCVIVNNLGGLSQLELYLMAGLVYDELRKRKLNVERQYTGTLMTSLDMRGIQVSLLKLPYSHKWLDTLDSETNAFAWPVTSLSQVPHQLTKAFTMDDTDIQGISSKQHLDHPISDQEANILRRCLKAAAEALVNNEETLNELDKGCGDGDTGSTLWRLADAILENINSLPVSYPRQCFTQLSKIAEDVMGGTCGALYSLMFVGASEKVPLWTAAWKTAMDTAMTYSKATLGSRTMFDALIPAYEAYAASDGGPEALHRAVRAAQEGCQRTRQYPPLFGRASYMGAEHTMSLDAGAFAVTVWLEAIHSQLTDSVEKH